MKAFKPKIVYPYHYRGMGGPTPEQNQQAFVAAVKGTAGVEVRTPNFYPAAPEGNSSKAQGSSHKAQVTTQSTTHNTRHRYNLVSCALCLFL